MRVAVVTIVHGRREHLLNQAVALASGDRVPDDYVVVAMNEPSAIDWFTDHRFPPTVVNLESAGSELPLAAARNLGARTAIDAGAELLVFLDVDCVATTGLVASYVEAAEKNPHALLSGAVGYLPAGVGAFSVNRSAAAHFHDFRPRLGTGETAPADPKLFWSLSFALTAATWRESGGFHEEYRGYGGEDTDFAQVAVSAGIEFLWVGGAEAFHQHHPSESPPVQHIDDILRNGRLFASRWGSWPMQGWLDAFEERGLAARDPQTGDWQRTGAEK